MSNFSTTGYKDNSPDRNNSHNVIPGNLITMKGVSKQLTLVPIINGKPQYDRKRIAKPGDEDIQFEDDVESVLEIPMGALGMEVNPSIDGLPPAINVAPPAYTPGAPVNVNAQQPPSFQDYAQIKQQEFDANQYNNNFAAPSSNTMDTTGMFNSTQSALSNGVDPNLVQQQEAEKVKQVQNNKPFNGAINPYGGWNMTNASTALGAFIDAKNPLGIIGSAGKILLEGTRNAMAGASAHKVYREGQQEYEEKIERQERRGQPVYQKGGRTAEIMTGSFIDGNENHPNPNTEVEKGEYLQTPDGGTMEVMGKKHSDGGEMLDLPGGTKVISDYLAIGAKNATFFKKEFGLNVKATNKFATVLDKYKKKIGLTELLEDEVKLMKKLEKQEEVEFEGTREINLEVLSQKIHEMQPEKEQMENRFEEFTNIVFDKQEETKEPGGSNFKKQEGGEVSEPMIDETGQPVPQEGQEQPQEGGSEIEQIIMAFCEMTGQDPAQVVQELQQLPEDQIQQAIEQMVQAIQQGQGSQPQQEMGQPMMRNGGQLNYAQKGLSVDDFNNLRKTYKWDADYEYGDIGNQSARLKTILDRLNIKYTDEQLSTQQGQDALAGQAQTRFRSDYNKTSNHYSSMVAPTQTGLQTALDNKLLSEKELTDLGVKVSNGKVLRGSKGILPKENESKLIETINKNKVNNAEGYEKYVDTNFTDNKWYYRFADVQDVNFADEKERDSYIKDNNFELTEDANGKKIYYSNTQGLYFNPLLNTVAKTEEAASNPQKAKDPSSNIEAMGNKDTNWDDSLPMLTPDQSNMRPNLLQPGLRTFGHVQANAMNVSPEETLKELNKQYNTASRLASETNPYTSGAMQADLQAKSNDAINQAYSQAAVVNAQDQRNVENTNEGRIQQRENSNIGALNNYEELSQRALDNYGQSWRNYYENQNKQNVNNWNLENQRQAFNATNDNYKIGAMGWSQTGETPVIKLPNGMMAMKDPATGEYHEVKTVKDENGNIKTITEKSGTKPANKRKGGLLLSKGIKTYLK